MSEGDAVNRSITIEFSRSQITAYQDSHKFAKVTCPDHGPFEIIADNILYNSMGKSPCPDCKVVRPDHFEIAHSQLPSDGLSTERCCHGISANHWCRLCAQEPALRSRGLSGWWRCSWASRLMPSQLPLEPCQTRSAQLHTALLISTLVCSSPCCGVCASAAIQTGLSRKISLQMLAGLGNADFLNERSA